MTYYNEAGYIIPASEIDLEAGYLVDKTTVHHPAVTHINTVTLCDGSTASATIVDNAALDEVTEQTYIVYADHPTEQDKLEAQVVYTAMMTDTMLPEDEETEDDTESDTSDTESEVVYGTATVTGGGFSGMPYQPSVSQSTDEMPDL